MLNFFILKGTPSQNDLRIDSRNHGTIVAGVIALNGPVNVKIINLKVGLTTKNNNE